MRYTCTFLVFRLEKRQNIIYCHLLKGIMFQYGIGFNIIDQRKYCKGKERRKVQEFIVVDETLLKVGSQYVWVWVAIEPLTKVILGICISFERTMLVAERFLKALVIEYGKHPLSTDGGTWYPQACRFLNIEHHIHSLYERSIIERTIQYIKDRTESFDDYFPCRKGKCMLEHVRNWFNLFVDYHNKEAIA